MASTRDAASYAEQALTHDGPGTVDRYEETELAAAVVINDLFRFFKLPKGAKILDAILRVDDIDTHATPAVVLSVEVFDGTSTAHALIHGSTVGQGAGTDRPGDTPVASPAVGFVTDDGDWEVRVICDTAPATTTTVGTIGVGIRYTMNLEHGD